MNKSANKKDSDDRKVGFNTSLGINLALGILFLTYLGYWIDEKKGRGSFWIFIGAIVGFIYAGYEIWKYYRSLNDRD